MSTEHVTDIQEIADRYYSGRIERGFLHWAMKCALADLDPDDDQVWEHTALDGPGDLGVDGYWIDELNRRLVLVQSKYGGRATRENAASFRGAIEALRDPDYVKTNGNDVWKEVYPEVLECILDESYSIFEVLACSDRVMPGAQNYARSEGSQVWQFVFEGATRRKDVQLEALDIEGLYALQRRQLEASKVHLPKIDLPVSVGSEGPSFHNMMGDFRAIQATVSADALVGIYKRFRSGIFRHNPRGPLGSNKVNKEIQRTLGDEVKKRHFHLLNNGLTVLCDTVDYDEAERVLHVSNFQVVNGCQTVYTLFMLQDQITEDVRVPVRIVEGMHPSWVAAEIPKATNYQTAVRPEQLASLGEEHDSLKTLFDRLTPPWFYEKQQGFTRFLTAAERKNHRLKYDNRSVTASELGQFNSAFMGHPILAKYDLRVLFERVDEGEELYNTIFMRENQPEQLLLPVLVGRQVREAVRQRIKELKEEEEWFSEKDWLPYARMHIVGLIGEILHHESSIPQGTLLPPDVSKDRVERLAVWFHDRFDNAHNAVEFYIEVEQEANRLVNLREFFRDKGMYAKMAERVRRRS